MALVVFAFALGLSAGLVVPGSQSSRPPDLTAMCTTLEIFALEVFDDGNLDRVGQAALENPNWARLQVLISSARAAGRADESLQDLAEAGNRLDFAVASAEWDVAEEQLERMREHC